MEEDLKYWLALSAITDIGPYTIKKLLSTFKIPENMFKAGVSELINVDGIGKNRAEQISNFSDWDEIAKTLDNLNRSGVKVVRYGDGYYPELLKQIHDAPFIFYVKGEITKEDRYAIAIVGSRRATPYGGSVTEKLSGDLASLGFTIISGMARGIDTIAHKAALKKGGRTIAVLGSGIDVIYPPENAGLLERIIENGAVISEFPPKTKPNRENFPIRNRVISGLSLGVLVVEAAHNSGSLITANYALEQGREVFAIPGNIMSGNTKGTHGLIQKGAKLVHHVDDIIAELAPVLKGFIKKRKEKEILLNDEEKSMCEALSSEPMHIDDITRSLNLALNKVLVILLNLELKGVVKQIDGKRFHLL